MIMAVAALWVVVSGAARAGNIFDDDWTPPPAKVVKPVVVAPATKPVVGPEVVVTPATKPAARPDVAVHVDPVVTTPVVVARRAIPGKGELAKSRKVMAEVFVKELSDKTAAARRALAEKLVGEAGKLGDNPSDQFVVLGGAIEAAEEGGSLPLCFKAADVMAQGFEVDPVAVKADAALKAAIKADATPLSSENVQAGLELMGQMEGAEDLDGASKVGTILQKAAGTVALKLAVANKSKEVEEFRGARDKAKGAMEKLASSANDPAANSAVGSYSCFYQRDWEKGLAMLAKGEDAKLKGAASGGCGGGGRCREAVCGGGDVVGFGGGGGWDDEGADEGEGGEFVCGGWAEVVGVE